MSAFRQPSRRRRNIQTIPFPISPLSLLRPRLLSLPRPTVICHLQNRCCSNFHVHVCVPPLGCPQGKGEKEKKEMGCCSPFLLLLRMQDISITGGKGGEIHSPSSSLLSSWGVADNNISAAFRRRKRNLERTCHGFPPSPL